MLIIINPNTIQIVYSYSPVLHKYYGIINILQYYTNSKLMYKQVAGAGFGGPLLI